MTKVPAAFLEKHIKNTSNETSVNSYSTNSNSSNNNIEQLSNSTRSMSTQLALFPITLWSSVVYPLTLVKRRRLKDSFAVGDGLIVTSCDAY